MAWAELTALERLRFRLEDTQRTTYAAENASRPIFVFVPSLAPLPGEAGAMGWTLEEWLPCLELY